MTNTDQSSPLSDNAQLEKLCRGFMASRYYRKAMEDIGCVREQGMRDFLKESPYGLDLDSDKLEEVVILLRINYYRYF